MAKSPSTALTVRERMLLFCIASGTGWQRAGVTGETVTALVVRGLLVRDANGGLTLTVALRCGRCCRGCEWQDCGSRRRGGGQSKANRANSLFSKTCLH